jgi:ankyrin repeat protein
VSYYLHHQIAILGSDVDILLLEVNESNINEVNLKGETALHLAAKNNSMGCVLMIETLIAAGANLNARNKWGQTSLHYAAIVESKESIDCLTNATNVDVNAKDANGYSALHCLINSNPILFFRFKFIVGKCVSM